MPLVLGPCNKVRTCTKFVCVLFNYSQIHNYNYNTIINYNTTINYDTTINYNTTINLLSQAVLSKLGNRLFFTCNSIVVAMENYSKQQQFFIGHNAKVCLSE